MSGSRAAIAVYQVGTLASTLMIIGGMYAAFVWRPAAFVMLAGAILQLAMHQVLGLAVYRRVMGRPWPKVAPLEDDDDDW